MELHVRTDSNSESFPDVEINAPEEEGDELDSDTAKLLTGIERSFALDTAALLGGNEYLIKQMLDEIEHLEYNEKELNVLRWGLTELWGDQTTEKVLSGIISEKKKVQDGTQTETLNNQKGLNKLFTKDNQVRLPRTLSNSLLYCGRHSDTKIYTNPEDTMQRYILINLRNFPYINFPIGHVPDYSEGDSSPRLQQCEKLAVLYFKLTNDAPSPSSLGARRVSAARMSITEHKEGESPQPRRFLNVNKPRERQLSESQKLSESLALEKGMLSRLHFVGIVPVPN